MKKLLLAAAVASLSSISAFADTPRVLHCGISGSAESPSQETLTHFALPGYEVGQVIVEGAAFSLKASYLDGELDMEMTEKATGLKVTSESYGGIPAGKMPKVTLEKGEALVIGYCKFK